MEGGGGGFEAEGDEDHDEGDGEEWSRRMTREVGGNFVELDGAGEAVDQAETKEEKRRRHAAEEKIFQRGLGGLGF